MRFCDSDFLVVWTGEYQDARVIRGWDSVLAYLDESVNAKEDGWSCREPDGCGLHEHDNWLLLGSCAEDDDRRFVYENSEFVYCSGLRIVRLTQPISQDNARLKAENARLREGVEKAWRVLDAAPELNMSNYTESAVDELNAAAVQAHEILQGLKGGA